MARLPLDGSHVIGHLVAEKSSTKQKLFTALDGLARLVPIGILLASPTIFGMTGVDLVTSSQFLITNFGVMALSWFGFPELITRTTPQEWKNYYQTGQASAGVSKVLQGSRIEQIQFQSLLDDLIKNQIQPEIIATAKNPGTPVLVVVVPDRLNIPLQTTLSQSGYLQLSTDELIETLR